MKFNHWVQMRLTAHSIPCGVIDGRIGTITIDAIKQFQIRRGLPCNGLVDSLTEKALRAEPFITSYQQSQIPDRDALLQAVDPDSQSKWPLQRDAEAFYGKPGTNQIHVHLPFELVLSWQPDIKIQKITLHKKVADSAYRAFQEIAKAYNAKQREVLGINQFGGSLNVRNMRGGKSLSMHAYGAAIDFCPQRNGLHEKKPVARLSRDDAIPFWEIWEKEGWVSLGRSKNFDWMHVQAARLA